MEHAVPSQDDLAADVIKPEWVAVPIGGPWCRECGHLWREGECQEPGCTCRHPLVVIAANADNIAKLDIDYS